MTELSFQGISWTARIRKSKGSCYICIPKPLVKGNFLDKGDSLQQFVAKLNDKVALITILDKDELEEIKTVKVERNTSIIQSMC